jgi:hypothetical protein
MPAARFGLRDRILDQRPDFERGADGALLFTGKVVMLTGCTLALGVATSVWSPIKFQADMAILLSFMFIWNMLGALIRLPTLAHFLLKPSRATGENGEPVPRTLDGRVQCQVGMSRAGTGSSR